MYLLAIFTNMLHLGKGCYLLPMADHALVLYTHHPKKK